MTSLGRRRQGKHIFERGVTRCMIGQRRAQPPFLRPALSFSVLISGRVKETETLASGGRRRTNGERRVRGEPCVLSAVVFVYIHIGPVGLGLTSEGGGAAWRLQASKTELKQRDGVNESRSLAELLRCGQQGRSNNTHMNGADFITSWWNNGHRNLFLLCCKKIINKEAHGEETLSDCCCETQNVQLKSEMLK